MKPLEHETKTFANARALALLGFRVCQDDPGSFTFCQFQRCPVLEPPCSQDVAGISVGHDVVVTLSPNVTQKGPILACDVEVCTNVQNGLVAHVGQTDDDAIVRGRIVDEGIRNASDGKATEKHDIQTPEVEVSNSSLTSASCWSSEVGEK